MRERARHLGNQLLIERNQFADAIVVVFRIDGKVGRNRHRAKILCLARAPYGPALCCFTIMVHQTSEVPMSRTHRVFLLPLFAAVLAFALTAAPLARQHQHPSGERLGTVDFETPCSAAAKAPFNHAMALLHSFEFGPAIAGFNEALKADPSCAMAYWGIAISRWTNPFVASIRQPAQLQQGLEAITQARKAGAKTER